MQKKTQFHKKSPCMSSWLPADLTKQDAVKQAQVLGVSVRTMEKWIDKLVQSTDIVRVTHGKYQKRDCKIA